MASLATIFNSPYYFGEISFEETKKILSNKPPNSYLFRKLKNGSITISTLMKLIGDYWHLWDVEIKNCNCEGLFLPLQRFKSLEDFIEYCDFVCRPLGGISLVDSFFKTPIFRKNPFSLEEMAKSFILVSYKNSMDNLIIPKIVKQDLRINHDHFGVMINEKEAIEKVNWGSCKEAFQFEIDQGPRPFIAIIPIINWKKWIALDPSNVINKLYLDRVPKFTLLNPDHETPIDTEKDNPAKKRRFIEKGEEESSPKRQNSTLEN